MKSVSFLRSTLYICNILLLSNRVATSDFDRGAYTDEEDQKYAESRFLKVGPYPNIHKMEAVREVAVFLNESGVCDLKPSNFIKLCEAFGKYRERRYPFRSYSLNDTLVPEKCKKYAVKLFWENLEERVTKSPIEEYFTTEFYWANKTESHYPVVQARKCPTTKDSPTMSLSDGRQKRTVFMYSKNTSVYLRLEDYLYFATHLYKDE